ncbi:2-amino-4-hydroxy-6-hydroxymethyldihydropteridine diphosphokinase [Metabacillus crassostreae]|uniref:2-amino-4-hydroxy-6- hydroxymethyldihydropteridine diphosphokinase n=1 Tax=Metabacillus crassostreae TaxID=929098 RepID=UPI001959EECB|nr:2-amino-4-hydroxy-6-hydroxymethyldihydropteridine diphosphokinase [Metabacillus crassostreae]MBM7606533.1 2-amino-4-hydroxy-6-hydroxymethyldihydropteridine diphosphokinase [Metabacillus crassostreae]
MKHDVYLALGSNIGDRESYLINAISKVNKHDFIQVDDISSIYETDPIGFTDQAQFLNMVIKVKTDLSAVALLVELQKIEKELDRKREVKWGPRTLDLDILLFNNENIEAEELIVPHPRMHERAFVLIPLYELDKTVSIPTLDQPIKTIIDQLHDKEGVRIWKQKNGVDVFALLEN